MKVNVYVLIDPFTFKVRYIGRTKNELKLRLRGHISKSRFKKTHKDCWIQSLLNVKARPIIRLFKMTDGWTESHAYEKSLIARCIKHGFDLTNLDDRGEGPYSKIISQVQRQKISETLKKSYRLGYILPTRTTQVSVYDLQGNFIRTYESLSKCSSGLSIPYSSLEKVLSKRTRRWKTYQITYGENPGVYKLVKDMSMLNKKVMITDTYTNTSVVYPSYKSAAASLGTCAPTTRYHLNKKGLFKKRYTVQMPV